MVFMMGRPAVFLVARAVPVNPGAISRAGGRPERTGYFFSSASSLAKSSLPFFVSS